MARAETVENLVLGGGEAGKYVAWELAKAGRAAYLTTFLGRVMANPKLAPHAPVLLYRTLDLPDEFRTMTIAGWHFHLDALGRALEGGDTDLAGPMPLWEPIHEEYVSKLRG